MANAASAQAVDISKERLREFLETENRHGNGKGAEIKMSSLDARGKTVGGARGEEEEEI